MATDDLDRTATNDNRILLTKHHGLGNDFLIAVDPSRPVAGDDALRWCDRRLGIGADGLIVATPLGEPGGGPEPVRRWQMVLWNADGSRAEISGNGIRCLGQAIAAHQNLDVAVDQQLLIETDTGTRTVTVRARAERQQTPAAPSSDSNSNSKSDWAMVRVGMGKAVDGPGPSNRWPDVGVAVLSQRGVDIGNPHLVAFVEDLGNADMAIIGPKIEADYPGGLNVHLVAVRDHANLDLLVWERGAGVTKACGSGACAAAWAANAAGLTGTTVTVTMSGGSAEVELTTDEVFLVGPAVLVGEVILHG